MATFVSVSGIVVEAEGIRADLLANNDRWRRIDPEPAPKPKPAAPVRKQAKKE